MEADIVMIEHCVNCKDHSWCTNHDESKYLNYYERLKMSIESTCPELTTVSNTKQKSMLHFLTSSKFSRIAYIKNSFPRLGSFEIYFRGQLVFSKLNEGKWPNAIIVANKIRSILDGIYITQKPEFYEDFQPQRAVTAVPLRSRSAKNLQNTRGERNNEKAGMIKTNSEMFKVKEQLGGIDGKKAVVSFDEKFEEIKGVKDRKREEDNKDVSDRRLHESQERILEEELKFTELSKEILLKNTDEAKDVGAQSTNVPIISANLELAGMEKENGANKNAENHKSDLEKPSETLAKPKEISENFKDQGDKPKASLEVRTIAEKTLQENLTYYTQHPINKTFTIPLIIGEETIKKISINNENETDMKINVEVSDNNLVKLPVQDMTITPNSKGVVKFSCMDTTPGEKEVYMLIKSAGQVLECHKLIFQIS